MLRVGQVARRRRVYRRVPPFLLILVHALSWAPMAQSSSHVLPTGLRAGPTTTRSNSLASTASSNSGASLRRRSRTRTRTLTSTRRGKSQGPAGDDAEDGQIYSANEDAPPLPPLLISDREDDAVSSSGESLVFSPPPARRFKPSSSSRRQVFLTERPPEAVFRGRERARSSANARDVDVFVDPTINRGRKARSEGGSIRGVCASFLHDGDRFAHSRSR